MDCIPTPTQISCIGIIWKVSLLGRNKVGKQIVKTIKTKDIRIYKKSYLITIFNRSTNTMVYMVPSSNNNSLKVRTLIHMLYIWDG